MDKIVAGQKIVSEQLTPSSSFANLINEQLRNIIFKEMLTLELAYRDLPQNAHTLVEAILNTSGHIVFSGTGKSGLIAQKLVATFSSLGIPSFFLHPHDALHGDLGMIGNQDLFIALSKSATGSELSIIIAALKSHNIITALISCSNGILTQEVDIPIVLPFTQEACSLNLAPTSSTTLTMAFGDALAVVTSTIKKFSKNDFAKFHPAGALGKQLLLRVEPLMYKKAELPCIKPNELFENFIITISEKKMGIGIVTNDEGALEGIITDGDLRRACQRGPQVFSTTAREIMSHSPKTITKDALAAHALEIMETFNITSLIVTEENHPIGVIHIHEIIKAGIKTL